VVQLLSEKKITFMEGPLDFLASVGEAVVRVARRGRREIMVADLYMLVVKVGEVK